MFLLAHFSSQIVHPSEANRYSLLRLIPAKPPKPQPRPKPHVSAYAVTGLQTHEKFSELNYLSKPAENKTSKSNNNPALYEPVYTYASGKGTAANTHSVESQGTSGQEQYYSHPTSPSQPPDLVPPTHMYHTLDSHKNSGQVSVHYEDPTLPAYQVCAFAILSVRLVKLMGKCMKLSIHGWK